jgi:hypothetical protein
MGEIVFLAELVGWQLNSIGIEHREKCGVPGSEELKKRGPGRRPEGSKQDRCPFSGLFKLAVHNELPLNQKLTPGKKLTICTQARDAVRPDNRRAN